MQPLFLIKISPLDPPFYTIIITIKMIALTKRCVHEHIIDLSAQIIDYDTEF